MNDYFKNESLRHKYLPVFLLVLYSFVWIWAAIKPVFPADWLLENVLVLIFAPLLIWSYYKFRLSNLSYILIFIFMTLHTIGSHYTYAEVPFGFFIQELFGLSRNHFDRIVHFSFGFLLAYPIREIFMRIAATKGFWNYWLPFEVTASFSALYEILEWFAAIAVDPSAGDAFLGSQGDIWDAQKDMALAILGAAIAMLITAGFNFKYNKKFGKEISDSLSVKIEQPLGEVKLEQMEKEYEKDHTDSIASNSESMIKSNSKNTNRVRFKNKQTKPKNTIKSSKKK